MPLPTEKDSGRDHPQFLRLLRSLDGVPRQANDDMGDFSEIEKLIRSPHNGRMSEPINRPELDAKLETIEARMDGRVARIEDKFDRMEQTMGEIKTMVTSQRRTIWGAAITTITLVLAAMGLFIASFDAGRDTAKLAADAQQQTNAALTEMRQIVESLRTSQK